MIWAYFIFTFLFKIAVKNTLIDFSLQYGLFQSDSHFIPGSTTYLLWFKTWPVNQIAPMVFRTVLLHPYCERFHAALTCNLPTCVRDAPLLSPAAVCLTFEFSFPWLLFFFLPVFQIQIAVCKGARGKQKVMALCWVIYGVFRMSRGIYWTSGRARYDWGRYDHSRGSVFDMELYEGQPLHQFLPLEIV